MIENTMNLKGRRKYLAAAAINLPHLLVAAKRTLCVAALTGHYASFCNKQKKGSNYGAKIAPMKYP